MAAVGALLKHDKLALRGQTATALVVAPRRRVAMTARASLRRALRPPRSSSLGTPEPEGARILNYSDPELIAELIEAHLAGDR